MRAVNLLPRTPKRTRKRPSAVLQLCLLAPFVVGSLLTAGYLLQTSKINNRKATLQALQAELAGLPAPAPQPPVNPQLAAERDQHVAALSAALQNRLAWDRILREISAVLPEDVWLTTLSAQGPTPVPVTPAPPTTTSTTTTTSSTTTTAAAPVPAPPTSTAGPLTITGYTYSQEGVARLLSRLAVVPALQNVKLGESTRSTIADRDVFSFTIAADVRPGETG
jgi:Tfp pilus assembly protein PilN